MHRVVGLCLDGVVALDLAGPAHAFTAASRPGDGALYEFTTCSPSGGRVSSPTGFAIVPEHDLSALERAQTILVPAYEGILDPPPDDVLAALAAVSRSGKRVISVCTGAFALAHAGLLDGRRATTHWAFAAEMARRFPAIEVEPAVLYVDEGEVMTSAGVSAGTDLALHVIRKDFGAAVGAEVARRMVAAPHREGGQAQFVERPGDGAAAAAEESRLPLERTRRWAARAPGRAARRHGDGAARRGQPAHLRPPLPRGDRDHAAAVAALPARARGPAPARGDRPPRRRDRLARRASAPPPRSATTSAAPPRRPRPPIAARFASAATI